MRSLTERGIIEEPKVNLEAEEYNKMKTAIDNISIRWIKQKKEFVK